MAVTVSYLVALWSIGIGAIYLAGNAEGTPHAELAAIAFAGVYAAPAFSALLASGRSNDALLLAAGVAIVVVGVMAGSIVTLPLVFPGAALVAMGVGRPSGRAAQALAVTVAVVTLAVGALLALIVHEDPAQWQIPNGYASTSDMVTRTESLISLGFSAALVVSAFVWVDRFPARS